MSSVGPSWARVGRLYRRDGDTLVQIAEIAGATGLSPDGTRVVIQGPYSVEVADASTGAAIAGTWPPDRIGCAALTNDDALFVGGGWGGEPGDALVCRRA